ncbi:MAG: redoxin domain-containing protein [Gemmatimonadota bacterium]|jgi:peroxiredoxin
MKKVLLALVCSVTALAFLLPAPGNLAAQEDGTEIGGTVPDFSLPDTYGKDHSISDYRGQYVVLEWLNYGCPSVKKHYNAGNMQMLQEKYTEEGVVWLAIVSSAPGKQGYYEPDEMNQVSAEQGSKASAVLLDPAGEVSRLYHAQVTPHMMVINPEGALIYNGAIDDKPGTRASTLEGAHNYVAAALDESMAGGEVSVALTRPYG